MAQLCLRVLVVSLLRFIGPKRKKDVSYQGTTLGTVTALSLLVGVLGGCSHKKFKVGDCIMPASQQNPSSILKVVGTTTNEYKVFTHFLSDGKLIMTEDYAHKKISVLNDTYSMVACPNTDGTFSPDKWLDKNR